MSDSLLDVRNLRMYFYGSSQVVRAVDDVSLSVREGEVVGIVGESGSGKTATALSLIRLLPPNARIVSGEILHKGKNLASLEETELRKIRGAEISMVFQDPMTFLDPLMKIGDQISESISLHQGKTSDLKVKVVDSLRAVSIPSPEKVLDYYPHQLSGGMKQRVLIAIALSCEPSLIIADEPTTALDVTVQGQILELLKTLVRKRRGLSLLLITHDLGVVAEMCDRVYVMYAGKIVEEADVSSLFKEPKHPYTQALLTAANSIYFVGREMVGIEGVVPDLTNPPSGCRFHPRCQYAMPICSEKEPILIDIGTSRAACWLYPKK
ncbi:MAG: ABC transporter ATP-binding protein [Thaumarchaeota archaeon]|nr:ABC transporter ATP-binding protein [Nitrososphaerota archaeon]